MRGLQESQNLGHTKHSQPDTNVRMRMRQVSSAVCGVCLLWRLPIIQKRTHPPSPSSCALLNWALSLSWLAGESGGDSLQGECLHTAVWSQLMMAEGADLEARDFSHRLVVVNYEKKSNDTRQSQATAPRALSAARGQQANDSFTQQACTWGPGAWKKIPGQS